MKINYCYIFLIFLLFPIKLYSEEYKNVFDNQNNTFIITDKERTQAIYKENKILFNQASIDYFLNVFDEKEKEDIKLFIIYHEMAHLSKKYKNNIYSESMADILAINKIKNQLNNKKNFINKLITIRTSENYLSPEHNSSIYLLIYRDNFLEKETDERLVYEKFKKIIDNKYFFINHNKESQKVVKENLENLSFKIYFNEKNKKKNENYDIEKTLYSLEKIKKNKYIIDKKAKVHELNDHISYYNTITGGKFIENITITN